MRASGETPGARRRTSGRYAVAATRAYGAAGIVRTAAGTDTTDARNATIRGQVRPDPLRWLRGLLAVLLASYVPGTVTLFLWGLLAFVLRFLVALVAVYWLFRLGGWVR